MNLKKLLKSGVFFTLLFGFTQSFAWQMVYHNDSNGNVVSGSLEVLIDAVKNGHEVRVMEGNDVSKAIYSADSIYLKNNKVYIKNSQQMSLTESDEIYKFQSPVYRVLLIYDTNGNVSRSRWLLGQNTPKGEDSYKTELKWFID